MDLIIWYYVIFDKGQYFNKISENGIKDFTPIIVKDSFSYPLQEEEIERIKLYVDLPDIIKAPIKKNEPIGNVAVYLDGKLIHEEKLITRENINKLGPINKILKKLQR